MRNKTPGNGFCDENRVESGKFGVDDGGSDGDVYVGELPADITSPASRVERDERHAILRRALAAMPENDRAILVMRHFDGMGNAECAAALGLTEKAASLSPRLQSGMLRPHERWRQRTWKQRARRNRSHQR